MKLLLDTHAAIWLVSESSRLSDRARAGLHDQRNRVQLSSVTVWEISIKRSLGKLEVPDGYIAHLFRFAISPLPITIQHAEAVEHLPHHHGDPFDRMLIAQAQVEGAAIVSRDPRFKRYDVPVLW